MCKVLLTSAPTTSNLIKHLTTTNLLVHAQAIEEYKLQDGTSTSSRAAKKRKHDYNFEMDSPTTPKTPFKNLINMSAVTPQPKYSFKSFFYLFIC